MRWIQKVNEDGTSRFAPVDAAAHRADSQGAAIHGDIQPFVSPIDGSVISDRKAYREHCKKHNVVPANEFSAEYYQGKAEERARHFTGQSTKEETFSRRQTMYELANKMERENG